MSEKKYNLAVFIGRFQPFHAGHVSVAKKALAISDKLLIMIGSAGERRTCRNPLSAGQVRLTIPKELRDDPRVSIERIKDYLYDDAKWAKQIIKKIDQYSERQKGNVCIVGHEKDQSSYYLKWKFSGFNITTELMNDITGLSGADIRKSIFEGKVHGNELFPEAFNLLQQDYDAIKAYKHSYSKSPYPPVLVTADVLIRGEHEGEYSVLLIKRKNKPYAGAYAMVGGFVNHNETIFNAARRELKEETGLEHVITESVASPHVFDSVGRSERGRIITNVFCQDVGNRLDDLLEKCNAGDDAESVFIQEIDTMQREDFFEDHYHIIKELTKPNGNNFYN